MQITHWTDAETDFGTKARVVVLAESAYVAVTETSPPASQDVKIPAGCSAIRALEKVIKENDERIRAMCLRNDRTRRALEVLRRQAATA